MIHGAKGKTREIVDGDSLLRTLIQEREVPPASSDWKTGLESLMSKTGTLRSFCVSCICMLGPRTAPPEVSKTRSDEQKTNGALKRACWIEQEQVHVIGKMEETVRQYPYWLSKGYLTNLKV